MARFRLGARWESDRPAVGLSVLADGAAEAFRVLFLGQAGLAGRNLDHRRATHTARGVGRFERDARSNDSATASISARPTIT